jgi:mono/diheme cytochrome c family protein
MNKTIRAVGAAAVAAIAVGALFLALSEDGPDLAAGRAGRLIDQSDQRLVARGKEVYANHCAACHGANLEGQPDWRRRLPNGRLPAPPHDATGHTWHHSDALLIDLVKNGLVAGRTAPAGYESDMPAFGQSLPDADIVAVLAYIKSTWPREVREAQERASLQDDRN